MMESFRVPILVSGGERVVDGKLAALCKRYGVRPFAKVRVADVLPVSAENVDPLDFSYALKAHFDFVIADAEHHALLAVEFDGPLHRFDPQTVSRDERKNRLCHEYMLPLLRVGAPALRQADRRTLLEWILEVWFEHRRLVEARNAMEEEDWDGDPPEIDPHDFNYRTAFALREEGMRTFAPLDAFSDAREHVGRWIWSRLGRPDLNGWYGKHPRGHSIGVLALEAEPGVWIAGRGAADLRGIWPWLDGLCPDVVAQDLALLDLSRLLSEWERGRIVGMSREGVDAMTRGLTRGELTWAAIPTKDELFRFTLAHLRHAGANVDDPGVFLRVYRSFHDEDRDYFDADDW